MGRFKHFSDSRSFLHFPNKKVQSNETAYAFGGVTFWLDASVGLNTSTNLGAVSEWRARVGGSVFLQSTAGNQPRLIVSDANYNNNPSVESTSTNVVMIAQNGLRYNSRDITVVVVSKVNTSNTINGIIGRSTASNSGINDGGNTAGFNGFGICDASSQVLQGTTETTNPRIKVITNSSIVVNGSLETTGIGLSPNYEFVRLYAIGTNSTSTLLGSIAEIIAFNYSMTSAQAIELSNRINQKYALY